MVRVAERWIAPERELFPLEPLRLADTTVSIVSRSALWPSHRIPVIRTDPTIRSTLTIQADPMFLPVRLTFPGQSIRLVLRRIAKSANG